MMGEAQAVMSDSHLAIARGLLPNAVNHVRTLFARLRAGAHESRAVAYQFTSSAATYAAAWRF